MIENITIKVTKISYGNQDIEILFDGERLSCSASYIGSDPWYARNHEIRFFL